VDLFLNEQGTPDWGLPSLAAANYSDGIASFSHLSNPPEPLIQNANLPTVTAKLLPSAAVMLLFLDSLS